PSPGTTRSTKMAFTVDRNWALYEWNLTASGNGVGAEFARWPDKSVTVTGTFGGGTVTLEGSNDGSNWVALKNHANTPISLTDEGIESVLEHTRYVRPVLTGATSPDLTITVMGAE